MATTLQKPPHPSQMDPRMRRAVYAKYREMLVSKHELANEMIKKLPAYMVCEDRGFNRKNVTINDAPPPPPIPSGHLPTQRLQTQMAEAPACVQNAMMTKDKKPFTYTPGGIDLSQIKSPRMAKRISANANSPGVSGPKISPLAQINNGNQQQSPAMQGPKTPQSAGAPPPPPPPSMGSLAMGMPFQVFPTGPPPPPPMKNQQQQLSAPPQTNGNAARKSPQHFEPPPMGCRPEIKIPENPMAILKKVPKPQPKDDYWIQEYVEDRRRSSIPQEEELRQQFSSPVMQQYRQQEPVYTPPTPIAAPPSPQVYQKPASPQRRSPSPPPPPQLERSEINIPIRNMKLEEVRSASPLRVHINQSPTQHVNSPQLSSSSPVTVTTVKNVTIEPIQSNNFNRPAQSYQPPQQQQQQAGGGKIILSTMPNRQHQAQQNLGSLYIPPPMSMDDKQYLLNQQSPQWMSSKKSLDTPEWVNRDEVDNFINQVRQASTGPREHVIPISVEKTPTRASPMPNFGPTPFYTPQHHINSVISPKVDPNANKFVNQGYNNIEFPQAPQQAMRPYVQSTRPQQQQQQQPAGTRIIPIQVEGGGARGTPQNDNTIVMQGGSGKYQYTIHNVPLDAALKYRMSRLSDPRSPLSPRVMPGFGAPTQSRSFKILQQVTGTIGDDSDESNESKPKNNKSEDDDAPMQEQTAIFSRPLGLDDMTESQLRRMQMSDNDRAFMNRIKAQVDNEVYLHSESDPRYKGSAIPSKAFKCLQTMLDGAPNNIQAAPAARPNQNNVQDDVSENQREPGLYQGSAIPSRSFKVFQQMTQPENAADNSNDNSDIEGNSYAFTSNNLTNGDCYQNCHNNLPNNYYYNHCTVPQIPPFLVPPQYAAYYDWYDPQNNPWAAYYYHPGCFDSNYFGGYMPSHSRSQTPQPQQQSSQQQQQPMPPPPPFFYPAYPHFVFMPPPFVGFRPISASRETTPCFSEAERYQSMSSTANDDRNRRAVSCTPTCCQHAKSFQVDNINSKFHTLEEPLVRSMSVQSDVIGSVSEQKVEENFPLPSVDNQIRKSLKSIPSVSNINLFNDDCDLDELKAKPIITNCDEEEDDASETSEDTEVEEEISQDTETVEVHFPHQLSVIYEENESAAAANERRSSICSRSSTLSDCSTTLMEEDQASEDERSGGDDLEDENSNSVTVRLPLKFSFTRSKDNMVNTTLTVGESESEVIENREATPEKSPSPLEVSPSPVQQQQQQNHSHSLSNNSSANDISVTFSLKSKSKSKTPERFITPTLVSVKCDSIDEIDDDRECSVSISLPRKKSKSIENENDNHMKLAEEENSENSCDNKSRIDNSLYTSIDALEEIKKGMAEITNSLFNRICTLRKSAINIPEQENGGRSGSVSYIESIESDSEENSYNGDHKEIPLDIIQEEQKKKDIDDEFAPRILEDSPQIDEKPADDEDEVDFWSQISPNKNEEHNLSKTSTRSSRYWFEEETDDGLPQKEDDFAKYETNDVTTSISFVSINDAETINENPSEDVDFWQGYDSDRDDSVAKAKKFFESETIHEESRETSVYDDPMHESSHNDDATESMLNSAIESFYSSPQKRPSTPYCENKELDNKSEYDDDSDTESCKAFDNEIINEKVEEIIQPPKSPEKMHEEAKSDVESDEEWTEEEVEESEEEKEIETPQIAKVQNPIENEEPTKDEENSGDDESDDEEPQKELKDEEEPQKDEESSSESEDEESDKDAFKQQQPSAQKSISSNKIAKGKSLVNVNSFVLIDNSEQTRRNKIMELLDRVDNMSNSSSEISESEEEEEEEEEETIEPTITLPKSSSNKSNPHSNDDCQDDNMILTTYVVSSHNNDHDKVLLSNLTQIPSVDSKSNMTSESGISFEQHDPDSEDGCYEEESDEEIDDNEEKTKETKIPQLLDAFDYESPFTANNDEEPKNKKEVKVNVKGKISMFERAMSEEKVIEKTKDIPKVSSKYSFRHRGRESSEPPISHNNENSCKRAVSELREVPKNQNLIDLLNQHKPQPVASDFVLKSMRDKISSFETVTKTVVETDASEKRENYRRYGNSKQSSLSTTGRSIDESGEEDSGVTSDFCKQFSENETDSENFPELRKLSRYERASTHSRLYKLLQGDDDPADVQQPEKEEQQPQETPATTKIPYKSKKIIHNVSVTRRQNPTIQAESIKEKRRRLCLPLTHQSSSGAESMSSSTTPSPTPAVNEKLVQELVQSLLSQKRGKEFRNLPIEKLHAAAVKILQEDLESLSSTDESAIPTVDSTPALTPQEFRNNSSYSEYYDSWQSNNPAVAVADDMSDIILIQSKAFKNLQDQQSLANKKLWSVRCPRILSSKSINKDLARLSEVRESESPEPKHSRSPSLRSMSTEPLSGENKSHHHHHQERLKAANT